MFVLAHMNILHVQISLGIVYQFVKKQPVSMSSMNAISYMITKLLMQPCNAITKYDPHIGIYDPHDSSFLVQCLWMSFPYDNLLNTGICQLIN